MGLYLPVNARGTTAIAVCNRCRVKIQYDELRKDPNNGNMYCKDCVDVYDPWRLPARNPENVTLSHPRPDQIITVDVTPVELLGTEGGAQLVTELGQQIGLEI